MSEAHRSRAAMDACMPHIEAAPTGVGVVTLIVQRPAKNERQVVGEGRFEVGQGLVGDSWLARGNRKMADGRADPEAEVTLMSSRAIAAVAGEGGDWLPAGDQLFVDLHLGEASLPSGSELHVGEAVLVVSAKPHTGCAKFSARFGVDAMRFVNSPVGRTLRLRGVNARVARAGRVRTGDPIRVVRAGEAP